MSLLDDELREATRRAKANSTVDDEIRRAVEIVLKRLNAPLADTWGCSHPGHLVTMIERLGRVSTEVQNVSESVRDGMPGAERNYREDLVGQLAELGGNVLVMLVEELRAIRRLG